MTKNIRKRDLAAAYVLTNWRVQKRLPRLTAYAKKTYTSQEAK